MNSKCACVSPSVLKWQQSVAKKHSGSIMQYHLLINLRKTIIPQTTEWQPIICFAQHPWSLTGLYLVGCLCDRLKCSAHFLNCHCVALKLIWQQVVKCSAFTRSCSRLYLNCYSLEFLIVPWSTCLLSLSDFLFWHSVIVMMLLWELMFLALWSKYKISF